jgi:hypothetical protein
MGAIVKNPTSQLLAAETPMAILNDSPTQMRIIDLNEARQLSQFTTVFVLVPATSAEGGSALSQIAKNNFMGPQPEALKILEFFNKNTTLSKTRAVDGDVVVGDVKVNFSTMEANRSGVPLILTTLEFKTLKYLIQNARRVISRDELLNEVWGYDNYPSTRTVDNQVAKLRKKLERDPSRPVHLRTVHGAGYKFMP